LKKSYTIDYSANLREVMQAIDESAIKTVFVVNKNNKLIGSITDGDIRRALLKGYDLSLTIDSILNPNPKIVNTDYSKEDVKKLMLENKIQAVPVIDNAGYIKDILIWTDIFGNDSNKIVCYKQLNVPVVIMAGGKGTRLNPLTKVLPKPLIPIGDRSMIEVIMDEYANYGIDEFIISINYKGKMIRAYLEESKEKYNINYIEEPKPLGTAGSLIFLKDKVKSPFFVSNCDILIKDDYAKIFDFHVKGNFVLTIVASIQHYIIPYGICSIKNGGELDKIIEKPEQNYLINTGMYIIEPSILSLIPNDKAFDITDLILLAKVNHLRIGVYPVTENSYLDVGQWDEYSRSLSILKKVN